MLLTGYLILLLSAQAASHPGHGMQRTNIELLLPNVKPADESVFCHSMPINGTINIVGYEPKAKAPLAHHMLVYACSKPGRDEDVWNCGDMHHGSTHSSLPHGEVCNNDEESTIVYAWAMDAPELKLPTGVAFKLGAETPYTHLVLQVHYKDASSFKNSNQTDNSGVVIKSTTKKQPKVAGIFMLLAGGVIPKLSTVYLDIACLYSGSSAIHPFAYRVHTHTLGKVVSGYVIKNGTWMEIGRMDPQKPHMFYNTTTPGITMDKDDLMAARCTMENKGVEDVPIGSTAHSEMCNFYVMYWVNNEEDLMRNKFCFNKEAPFENWLGNLNASLLQTMPKNVSVLPGTNTVFKEKYWTGGDVDSHEMMDDMQHKKSDVMPDQQTEKENYDYEELKRMLVTRAGLEKDSDPNLDYTDIYKDTPYWKLKEVVDERGDGEWLDREKYLDYADYPSERVVLDYPSDRRAYETSKLYRDAIKNEYQKRYNPYDFFATEGMKKRRVSYSPDVADDVDLEDLYRRYNA